MASKVWSRGQRGVADGDQPPELALLAGIHPDQHGGRDDGDGRDGEDDRAFHAGRWYTLVGPDPGLARLTPQEPTCAGWGLSSRGRC